jgi:release factor glutamine methyltransferase
VPSLRDELARGAARLAAAGCESPRLDAELLMGEALGLSRAELVMRARDALDPDGRRRFDALVARRAAREPIAYILGRREFRRLELAVDRRVLIPRPETELLVELGLELPPGSRVADVGTGSGAVALALTDERPDLRVTGIDTSAAALAVAQANGRRLALDVRWIRADLLDDGRYDAVLANLPYVEADARLAPEIVQHEPAEAVFAGPDGLEIVRRLVGVVKDREEVATVGLEIGAGQADVVAGLLEDGFASVERRRDLAGHERLIVGRR